MSTTSVGVTSYSLDATILQDPIVVDGISAYLFEHDTKEAFFYLGVQRRPAARCIAYRVRLVAGAIGGDATG